MSVKTNPNLGAGQGPAEGTSVFGKLLRALGHLPFLTLVFSGSGSFCGVLRFHVNKNQVLSTRA